MKFVVQPAYRLKIPILIASKPKHLMGQCQTRWSDSFTDFNCKLDCVTYLCMNATCCCPLWMIICIYTHIYWHIYIYTTPPLAFDDHVARLCLRIQFAPRRELTIHLNGLRKQFNGFIARGLYFKFYANNAHVLLGRFQFSFLHILHMISVLRLGAASAGIIKIILTYAKMEMIIYVCMYVCSIWGVWFTFSLSS